MSEQTELYERQVREENVYRNARRFVGVICVIVGAFSLGRGLELMDTYLSLGSIPCLVLGIILVDPFGVMGR